MARRGGMDCSGVAAGALEFCTPVEIIAAWLTAWKSGSVTAWEISRIKRGPLRPLEATALTVVPSHSRATLASKAASVGRDVSSTSPVRTSISILCPISLDSNPSDSSCPYLGSSTSGTPPMRRRRHQISGLSEEEEEEEEAFPIRTVMPQPSLRRSPSPHRPCWGQKCIEMARVPPLLLVVREVKRPPRSRKAPRPHGPVDLPILPLANERNNRSSTSTKVGPKLALSLERSSPLS
ncbi:ribosomal L29 family protein [Striga asiatica]|uniref:Ribosomal L29 family protein n=1 Tax=Striga asiatica TaxID=4170 RepID=A0A5A7PNS1_STRAF|nr:ribosomal L29 family protein [Striga asiatica]